MKSKTEHPSYFIRYLAQNLGKSVRTIRRYCEQKLVPGVEKTAKHYRLPGFANLNSFERRAFAERVADRVAAFERGSHLNPARNLKVGQLIWPDKEEEIAYWTLLDVLPQLSEVGASEERDWDPYEEVNFDRETLAPGPNIKAARELWNMQSNVRAIQLYAIGNVARKLLREGTNPTVERLATTLLMSPRSLYAKLGAEKVRTVINEARQIEARLLPAL